LNAVGKPFGKITVVHVKKNNNNNNNNKNKK
jgi:hypothetical protein